MKNLNNFALTQVSGGSSHDKEDCASSYEDFKKDVTDAYESSLEGLDNGSSKLSEKIHKLIDKHKK